MVPYFRAIALDYDGTLTDSPRPKQELLDALAELRSSGWLVVMVTGRILAELRADFPTVDECFDLIVAENGAVLSRSGQVEDVTTPVDSALTEALSHRDVPIRHGRVLLACDGQHASVVLDEITRLELDCQLIRNRGALMILPAGVSKGTGLLAGLHELGISPHNVVGVGDAENDHSLLSACEIGVAVYNAVDALKQHADLVLDEPDGQGVLSLLRGPLLSGEQRLHPSRWQLDLGTDAGTGKPVRLPGSQSNVLITGPSGSGKSHIAGLLVEQLIHLGYAVLVLDPEGEHGGLATLPGTLWLGGAGSPLPPPPRLRDLFSSRLGSLVLDLSRMPSAARMPYLAEVADVVVDHRAHTGLPHWVLLEEAHLGGGSDGLAQQLLADDATGVCLVTYQPMALDDRLRRSLDAVITGNGAGPGADDAIACLHAYTGQALPAIALKLSACDRNRVLLATSREHRELRLVTLGPRRTTHVRHRKKYAEAELPQHLRFFLHGRPASAAAANLGQLHHLLESCEAGAIGYHCGRGDFSRWLRDVLCDAVLADEIADIERDHVRVGDAETTRGRLLGAIQSRYLLPA